MKKPPITMNEKMSMVQNRYGKTLGASKGKSPLPPSSVRVKPTMDGLKPVGARVKVTKKL